MFFCFRPNRATIERFVSASHRHEFSYPDVGMTRSTNRSLHESTFVIGQGASDFARARAALQQWKQFDLGWVELHPHGAPVVEGTNVAVLIRHLGIWSLNGCRVLYTAEESSAHFAFAYGTLTTHAESGEERFEVLHDPDTDEVLYRIRARGEARALLARLGTFYVRKLQEQFRQDSAAAMRRAVAG